MQNHECLKDLMLYIEANLSYKEGSGKVIPVKMIDLVESQELGNYFENDIYRCFDYLKDAKYIAIDPSSAKCSNRHQKISKILPNGENFLEIISNKSIWDKIKAKNLIDSVCTLIGTGKAVYEIVQLINGAI